jgi:hypothetical protein
MHPDQATDSIVDAAVMYSKPFAVVVITFHGTPCPCPALAVGVDALAAVAAVAVVTAVAALATFAPLLFKFQLPDPFTV